MFKIYANAETLSKVELIEDNINLETGVFVVKDAHAVLTESVDFGMKLQFNTQKVERDSLLNLYGGLIPPGTKIKIE